ncbi:MAG TPA: protein phosphatase 2C domain-containing protein [Roseiflexaceae bacterium]|nr:protein phosphatase 2C domain-containing protein [Roseiflexaceae bacterium]
MISIDCAGLSEQGPVRDNNEDCIACHSPADPSVLLRKGALFVVADGVGGNRAGEVASREATQKLIDCYYASTKRPRAALQSAFQQTNLHICDLGMSNPAYRRMETTLSALVLVGNQLHIGHVGDTRIYQVRETSIQQLTRDHSEVGELVRMQILTPEEAQHHPRRHIITRSIGGDLMTQIDFHTEAVQLGDCFVLCTDGLWESLAPAEIVEATLGVTATESCRRLVELALERATTDNLSVQVINVVELNDNRPDPSQRKNGFLQRTFGLFGNSRLSAAW